MYSIGTLFWVTRSLISVNLLLPQGITGGKTYLEAAAAFACSIMKARVISSPGDQMAVVFYGSRETKNETQFEFNYEYQGLEQPSADKIRTLSDFSLAQVRTEPQPN